MKYFPIVILLLFFTSITNAQKVISITIDDPDINNEIVTWQEINIKILKTLSKNKLKAALFVCGMRIDNKEGEKLLNQWDKENHLICNHSYSHSYFNSKKNAAEDFIKDFEKCDTLIDKFTNYTKLFRYPYLKEGNSRAKIDSMRFALLDKNYKVGHVSIDASDWFIDSKIIEQLKVNPKVDLAPYKDYYIKHILERANYYDSLAKNVINKQVKHTLLLHHSLLNALFLNDIIVALKNDGWEFIAAKEAYKDTVYNQKPTIIPCGESLIWQLVKQIDTNSVSLRYPGEDSQYEELPLEEFIKNYKYNKKDQVFLNNKMKSYRIVLNQKNAQIIKE